MATAEIANIMAKNRANHNSKSYNDALKLRKAMEDAGDPKLARLARALSIPVLQEVQALDEQFRTQVKELNSVYEGHYVSGVGWVNYPQEVIDDVETNFNEDIGDLFTEITFAAEADGTDFIAMTNAERLAWLRSK
jgi:hypothetical protein